MARLDKEYHEKKNRRLQTERMSNFMSKMSLLDRLKKVFHYVTRHV